MSPSATQRIKEVMETNSPLDNLAELDNLKVHARKLLSEIEDKKLENIRLGRRVDTVHEGYFSVDYDMKVLLEGFLAKQHQIVQETQASTDDLNADVTRSQNESEDEDPELIGKISLEDLTPEQRQALETPAIITSLREVGIISKNGEIHLENPKKLEQVAKYADYMYFIDNVERDGEAKISDVKGLVNKYKNLLSEGMSWMGEGQTRYLQHKYTHAIYDEIIRRGHIVRKDADTNTFSILKYDGTPADANDTDIKELLRVLDRDDVRVDLLEVAIVSSIVKKNTLLDRETIVSPKELAIRIIEKHDIRGRNGQDLEQVEFSLIDWEGNGKWSIGTQIDRKLAVYTEKDTASAQELMWFRDYVKKGDYRRKTFNRELFTQMNMYRKGKASEAALMKSIPKDLTIDPANPEKSIGAIVERLGNGNKGEMLVAGFVALLVAKFVLKGKSQTLVGGFGAASILAPFILGMAGSVLGDIEQEIPSSELELIEWKDVAPSLNVEQNQQKVFDEMIKLKNSGSSLVESRGVDNAISNPGIGVYRSNEAFNISNEKLGFIFEAATEIETDILFPHNGDVSPRFVSKFYELLGGSASGGLMIGGERISKTEVKAFIELLIGASPATTNLKDALVGGTDIENENYDYLHTITGVDDFDERLNEYMRNAWNSDIDKQEHREEVKNLQRIIQAGGSKWLPSFMVEGAADIQSIFFEEDAISKIEGIISDMDAYNFNGSNYKALFESFLKYMKVNNDFLGYKANIFKKSNREGIQDTVETVGNSARSVMAKALGVAESGVDESINALLKLGDTGENILRGMGNVAISLIPDWRGAEDAVRGFVDTQIETYRNTPRGQDTNGVDISFDGAVDALSPEDQRRISDILPGINSTVEKQIEKLEKMLNELEGADESVEVVRELEEKIQRELAKVREIQRDLVGERLASVGIDNSVSRSPGELYEVLNQTPELLLREIREVNRYMEGFTSVRDILESGNKEKINVFKEILSRVSSMHIAFSSDGYDNLYQEGKRNGTPAGLVVVAARDVFGEHLSDINTEISTIESDIESQRNSLKTKISDIDTSIDTYEEISLESVGTLIGSGTELYRISKGIEASSSLSDLGDDVDSLNNLAEAFNKIGDVDVSEVTTLLKNKFAELKPHIESYITKVEQKDLNRQTKLSLKSSTERMLQILALAKESERMGIRIDVSNVGSHADVQNPGNASLLGKLRDAYFEKAKLSDEIELKSAVIQDLNSLPASEGALAAGLEEFINSGKTIGKFESDIGGYINQNPGKENEIRSMLSNTIDALDNKIFN